MFLRKTIGYVNKNIIFMLLLSLLPAACFTFGGQAVNFVEFFVEMVQKIQSGNTGYTFFEIFNHFSIINIYQPWRLGIFVPGLFLMGIVFSLVERNMKYHTVSIGSFRSMMLDALCITLPAGLIFLLAVEVAGLIISGFVALFALLGSVWLWFALSLAMAIVVYFVLISFVSYLVCWLPCVSMEGIKFFMAASLSARMTSKNHGKILATVGITMLVEVGLVYVVNMAGIISYTALCAVMNVLMCMYLPSYCYTAYFRLSDIPMGAKR